MFNREELFEYFSDRYTKTQIIAALHKLAESSGIDPEAEEFSSEITTSLERIFQIIEDAAKAQKQLAPNSPSSIAQIQKIALDLASDRAVQLPVEIFQSLVEILVGEALVSAQVLSQIQEAALKQALAQKNQESLENLGNDAATRIQLALKLVNDPETLERLLQEFGVKAISQTEKDFAAAHTQSEFDPDAFLQEVADSQVGELSAPKTIADTKALIKTFISSKKLNNQSL